MLRCLSRSVSVPRSLSVSLSACFRVSAAHQRDRSRWDRDHRPHDRGSGQRSTRSRSTSGGRSGAKSSESGTYSTQQCCVCVRACVPVPVPVPVSVYCWSRPLLTGAGTGGTRRPCRYPGELPRSPPSPRRGREAERQRGGERPAPQSQKSQRASEPESQRARDPESCVDWLTAVVRMCVSGCTR